MLTDLLLKSYSLAEKTGILESAWVRRRFVDAYWIYKQHWEDPYAGLVRSRPNLFQGGHIVDVGANIGYTSTLFARAADTESVVYAFEPDPANFETLQDTIVTRSRPGKAGKPGKIIPICAAVGGATGTTKLWRNPASHADHRICTPELATTLPTSERVIDVPLVSLDSFLSDAGIDSRMAFVKIDVQGYELPVLKGMVRTLDASPDLCVAFEYMPEGMRQLGFDPVEPLDLLERRGFTLYVLDQRGGLRPFTRESRESDRRGYLELLASRKAVPTG